MILESVRAFADWLAHPTHGVQAALGTLVLDGTDVVPSGTLTISDETRSDVAATERPGVEPPYIRVQAGDVRGFEGQSATYTHDADVPLEILVVRQATSPAAATRDCYYTTRAVLRVIEQLFNPNLPAAVAAIARNGVQLQAIQTLSAGRIDVPITDNTITAAVFCTLRVRDTLA